LLEDVVAATVLFLGAEDVAVLATLFDPSPELTPLSAIRHGLEGLNLPAKQT
jgi:hypothetical protein